MRIYIKNSDVVANAFVILLDHGKSRKIYYADIDNYASIVIDKLNSINGIRAMYSVSKESNKELIKKHSDFFEEFKENNMEIDKLDKEIENITLTNNTGSVILKADYNITYDTI